MAATNKSIVSPRTPPVWLDWPYACKAVRSIPNTTRHSRRDEVRLIASIAASFHGCAFDCLSLEMVESVAGAAPCSNEGRLSSRLTGMDTWSCLSGPILGEPVDVPDFTLGSTLPDASAPFIPSAILICWLSVVSTDPLLLR